MILIWTLNIKYLYENYLRIVVLMPVKRKPYTSQEFATVINRKSN